MKYETRFPGAPMCAGLSCLNPGNPTVLSRDTRATRGPLLLADPDCVMGPGKLSLSRPIASDLGSGSVSVSKAFNIPYSIWNYSSVDKAKKNRVPFASKASFNLRGTFERAMKD